MKTRLLGLLCLFALGHSLRADDPVVILSGPVVRVYSTNGPSYFKTGGRNYFIFQGYSYERIELDAATKQIHYFSGPQQFEAGELPGDAKLKSSLFVYVQASQTTSDEQGVRSQFRELKGTPRAATGKTLGLPGAYPSSFSYLYRYFQYDPGAAGRSVQEETGRLTVQLKLSQEANLARETFASAKARVVAFVKAQGYH